MRARSPLMTIGGILMAIASGGNLILNTWGASYRLRWGLGIISLVLIVVGISLFLAGWRASRDRPRA